MRRYSAAAGNFVMKRNLGPGIMAFTLNDPKRRNCLSEKMLDELILNFKELEPQTKIIIIDSVRDCNVFSSGHNLKEFDGTPEEQQQRIFKKCTSLMMTIHKCPIPTLSVVRGLATAAGCQLALACDMCVAGENAKFQTPGVQIGLFCSTPGVELARSAPSKIAMKMLYTGLPITARKAEIAGLVTDVVAEDKLDDFVQELAENISSKSQETISYGKKVFWKQRPLSIEEAYGVATPAMCENLQFDDAKEGINAFVQKRKPTWKSKM